MALIAFEEPWTRQPPSAAPLRPAFARNKTFVYSPTQPRDRRLLTTGTPTIRGTNRGRGYTYGSGNYHSFAAGILRDSAGAGGDATVAWRLSVSFVVTSNAATDAICSIGQTATDGGAQVIVQNNAGTLRASVAAAAYSNLGSAVIGKLHTVDITYSDISPYPQSVYLDGVFISSANAYVQWSTVWNLYLGSGFPAQTENARIIQATLEQGIGADQAVRTRAANPVGGIYLPQDVRVQTPSATVQLLRPTSDISAGAWTPSSGSDLYAMLDETTFNDADYIQTTSASTSEVKFGTGLDPNSSTGHTIRYRAKGTGTLTVTLREGATLIATHTPTLTTSFQTFSFTLSGGEADSITNYGDLRLRFVSS